MTNQQNECALYEDQDQPGLPETRKDNMHYVTKSGQKTKTPRTTGAIIKEPKASVSRLEIGQHEVSYVAKYETPAHNGGNKQRTNSKRSQTRNRTTRSKVCRKIRNPHAQRGQ